MLVDFEVENFRSYREAKRFSLVASPIEALPQNMFATPEPDLKLLKTAAIYGPNGSGKSNLILAMNLLSEMIRQPPGSHFVDTRRDLFALNSSSASKPIRFKTRFFAEGILFEYTIAVTSEAVHEEKLTAYSNGHAQAWFARNMLQISFPSPTLKDPKNKLKELTKEWMPFLTVAATYNEQISIAALGILKNLGIPLLPPHPSAMFGLNPGWFVEDAARRCHEDRDFGDWANSFLRHADVGIQLFHAKLHERTKKYEPYFVHSSLGVDGQPAEFELWNESQGTRLLFDMLVPVYQALKEGQVIVLDELNSLHPLMARELVRLFQDPEMNKNNAQLVFATHDASLLDGRIFRRDQVWFTEKDRSGATDLYSLVDFKPKERDSEEAVSEAGYLRGRYGAIPFFTPFNFPQVPDGTTNGGQSAKQRSERPKSSRTKKGRAKVHPDSDGR
jgi:AAA15 family ATPase/GTPase